MDCEWKYFISLNDNECYHWLVEDLDDDGGILICNDVAVAKCFKSTEELLDWVKTNTSLNSKMGDFNIEGQYLPCNL